jgi:hypothetical protein
MTLRATLDSDLPRQDLGTYREDGGEPDRPSCHLAPKSPADGRPPLDLLVMRSRICSSSLVGCQPSLSQLAEIWDLALRGVDNQERQVSLTYLIEDRERIVSQSLDALIKEAESPKVLENLTLSARQYDPHREVLIQVGPGRKTLVTVEAEDHTWAIGRHTEVMERLSKTRKWYAGGEPAKFLSWPEKGVRKEPLFSVKNAAMLVSAWVIAAVAVVATLVIAELYIGIVYLPTYLVVQAIRHHRDILFGGILLEFSSLAVISATVYVIGVAIAGTKSKVIIQPKNFWSKRRVAVISTLAAVIAAIASILALFK